MKLKNNPLMQVISVIKTPLSVRLAACVYTLTYNFYLVVIKTIKYIDYITWSNQRNWGAIKCFSQTYLRIIEKLKEFKSYGASPKDHPLVYVKNIFCFLQV